MKITIHHQPLASGLSYKLHVWQLAWDGNLVWDMAGTPNGNTVDFQLPDLADPRTAEFQYNSTNSAGRLTWEPASFIRQVFQLASAEVWTFESSGRILYQNPFPPGVGFNPGDTLTVQVITKNQFRGGQIYVWDPYNPANAPAYFSVVLRDDPNSISTFKITLAAWMTAGFHFKLTGAGPNGQAIWEPDTANRVWRPVDGSNLWIKSGENDVRSAPLALAPFPVEVLYPASMTTPPAFTLTDVVEQVDLPLTAASAAPYPGCPLFNVATYVANIYPGAGYTLTSQNNVETPSLTRPFPMDPADATVVSRLALGASAWLTAFPVVAPAQLAIQPHGITSFGNGVSARLFLGNTSAPYQTAPAVRQADGSWLANLDLLPATTTSVRLLPATGADAEARPYDWIDTGRYFTPVPGIPVYHVTEGVYGICAKGPTVFANPPDRTGLMQAMFGAAVVNAGIFAPQEMPHGTTLVNGTAFFVVHAPHAVCAALILVSEAAPGGPARVEIPMTLTNDTLYWWCQVPATQAGPGTRYHFLLNDNDEILDPAARAVQDRSQSITAGFGDNPADPDTSWSVIADVAGAYATAHAAPWQTMGWQNLLVYELHANRFTNLNPGGLMPLDLLADELSAACRRATVGYLRQLPVTAFELLPVSEFSSTLSWGYDPSYYFAIDGFYGGAPSLANFVNTAHQNGRAVILDVVYNHSLGSSLMQIAPDVYRNGDYDGDRMNCGHPMVGEFFRQATIYLWRTFGLDGFRFDDTKTIITECTGGWQFLGMIRSALRGAATAEGRAWPYCVAENSDNPWAVSDPTTGVMDGQWEIDESYRIRDVSYDPARGGDNSDALVNEMNQPAYFGRPFQQATRFGESHDMVSEQDPDNRRIAARAPAGQGLQLAKSMGTLTLLSNGVPMLFMGQEVGETLCFSFDDAAAPLNPQLYDLPLAGAPDQTRVLAWFRQLMGLRNDPAKGLQGNANYQVVGSGNRTIAFTCGAQQQLFVVVTFDTPNQQQNSGWLGLPGGAAFKEIFNSSWTAFQVGGEPACTNGGYSAQIYSGQILNLPAMGAVVLEKS